MGNSCCQESKLKRRRMALLLVGLDNAGKTVTAKGLAGEPIDYPIPTIGFSVIELKYLHYDIRIFDLGGGPSIRGIWHKYFVDVHGVIFVVDSCDLDRFHEVREVLEEILSSDKIMRKPLLILANKQDQESAFDEIDIIECLKIEELVNRYKCPTLVQSCCANEMDYNKTDPGIKKGYEWIVNYIHENYDNLNFRVQIDVIDQGIKEKQQMLEKIERIKAEREALLKDEDPDAIQTFSDYVSKINGEAMKHPDLLEVVDFYPNPEESENAGNDTSDSSITFPEIYCIKNYDNETERPRSAVQLVRHQLRMNDELRRSQSAKIRRNQTAPIKTLQAKQFIPVTEKLKEVTPAKPDRKSKTADDRIFTISRNNIGPGGDTYAPSSSRERFTIEERFKVKKLPALTVKSKAQINREDDMNGICIVDVE